MSEGMKCHNCEQRHLDWTDDGRYTVDDGHHAGIIQRWECGNCGAITEGEKALEIHIRFYMRLNTRTVTTR
jgi:hypothetical protein